MKKQGAHDKIKVQIAAFLFNNRADVLREELYRALCLHVLSSSDDPLTIDEITPLVAYAIDSETEVTDSLRAIVTDELNGLARRREVSCQNGTYWLDQPDALSLPSESEVEIVEEAIYQEIERISLSLKPRISAADVSQLYEFFCEVCEVVAREQVVFVARGEQVSRDYLYTEDISTLASQARESYQIDQIIDADLFIQKCFLQPSEILSTYAFLQLQVHLIFQLLTWDPGLEYLRNEVLKNKTLYLDSSALFALMQKTHPLHEFLDSLIAASIKDLSVNIKVHKATLDEYEEVLRNYSMDFQQQRKHLSDLVKMCNKENRNFAEVVESSVYVDYLEQHSDHIDLGSWQRYTNQINRDAVVKKFDNLGASVDNSSSYVPEKEFHRIRDNVIRASLDQARRGKRRGVKTDATHDAQMYYLIRETRHRATSEISLGYDTYLITLDGSLTYFAKYEGLPWTETYFLFPNQWYEIAFPFLRISRGKGARAIQGFASLAFSQAFSSLEALIPLHIYGYVFDLGGDELTLKSVREIIEASMEERLIERLDPANTNLREREAAKLEVQRLIAEKTLEEENTVQKLTYEAEQLERKRAETEAQIYQNEREVNRLGEEIGLKEGELSHLDHQLEGRANIDDIYRSQEEIREEVEDRYEAQISDLKETYQTQLENLNLELEGLKRSRQQDNREIQSRQEEIEDLESKVGEIQNKLAQEEAAQKQAKIARDRQIEKVKKILITSLMAIGVLALIFLEYVYDIGIAYTLIAAGAMILGMILYLTDLSPRPRLVAAFLLYGLGLVVAFGKLFTELDLNPILWAIPMGWELLIFASDRLIERIPS